jgi:SAM-dependent methyltransferase
MATVMMQGWSALRIGYVYHRPTVVAVDTKQAEKAYLARTGSDTWERAKPFSPPGSDTLDDSARMLHDFAVAMLTLQPSPEDLILDLGAGACWCSDLLGRLNRSSVAVDISVDMLGAGQSRPGTSIRAVAGDMESLPFRSGAFQKAICLSAIHHVPNIPAAVREIARVLDSTGAALFSEPGRGHAEAPVAAAAMRDFGVLEQDILVADFVRACRDAGFEDVRIKPLAYTVPGFDLTLDEWDAWTRLAASKRPRRALQKMLWAGAELLGLGKRGSGFEDAFAISLVRTLRPIVEHHPIIVASKSAATAVQGRKWGAALRVDAGEHGLARDSVHVTLHASNTGTSSWRPSSRAGIGHVTCGVQLLDSEGRLVSRDHHRELLPNVVAPGEAVTLAFDCPLPAEPGNYGLKFDLVAEGVTWFETAGSTTVSRRVMVTASTP